MKFGITQSFDCSYLPQQQEKLLIYAEDKPPGPYYETLLEVGFRRSGEQIYRPHCDLCQACQSIRIPVVMFRPTKSQKRLLNRNQDIKVVVSEVNKAQYYALYEQYINQRHDDGSMYPASEKQYASFLSCNWITPLFIEFFLAERLIAVAVTDQLQGSLSALYTFFAPDQQARSLGTFAVLQQISIAAQRGKKYVYLGYQIDSCQKMSYKRNFLPHERFFQDKWQLITKKEQ
jgi:arginyl-tRNA--protein-N-Asp/Glu arginylyltransferase